MLEEMKMLRDNTVGKWEEVLQGAKTITEDFLGSIDAIEQELADRAKVMHKQVETILNASKQTLQEMKTSGLTKLQDQEKYLGDRLQQLKDDVKRYEDQLNYGDPNALLQYKEGTIQNDEKKKPPSLEIANLPVFTKGQDDVKSMERMFGQISSHTTQQKNTSPASTEMVTPSESGKAQMTSKSQSNRNAVQMSLIPNPSVMSQFEVKTSTPHIAYVDRGLAWVMTRDRTLQLVDREGAVKDTINTDYNIFDIEFTSNGDLLLADYHNRCIMSVSGRKMISTSWKPWGICGLHNGDIVVTFPDDRKVVVYSRDGQVRRTLDNIKFRFPRAVAVNKVNQDIYICDVEDDYYDYPGKLLAVGADHRLRYEYTGQGDSKFTPVDVCSDQMGHVLVTDYINHRVHILDQEGQFIQYIPTSQLGLYQPVTIDVDREGYVWVGGESWRGGQVKVARCLQ